MYKISHIIIFELKKNPQKTNVRSKIKIMGVYHNSQKCKQVSGD